MPAAGTDSEQVPIEKISKQIEKARILPRGATQRVSRKDQQVLIEVSGYPTDNAKTQKIDAILLARLVVRLDPANSRTIVSRFKREQASRGFTDAIVSGREIAGAEAGAMSSDELVDAVVLIPIAEADTAADKARKYIKAAVMETGMNGLHEAEHLFGRAVAESKKTAGSSSSYARGMLKLAEQYRMRGDDTELDRVYGTASEVLCGSPHKHSYEALEKIGRYYMRQKDYETACRVASNMVSMRKLEKNPDIDGYVHDLVFLASCHRRLDQLEQATKELEQAMKLRETKGGLQGPASARLLEELGDCYAAAHDIERARDMYKQSKTLYDIAVGARKSKERIPYEVYQGIVGRLRRKMAGDLDE